MTRINNSLEWNNLETTLINRAIGLIHERDIRRMISNIRLEIVILSKVEVLGRRGQTYLLEDKLEEVNKDIELVEEYLLVARLLG